MGAWRVVFIALLLWGCVGGQFVCNSGSLDAICTVDTTQVLTEQLNSIVGDSLVILQPANLTCSLPLCVIEVIMNGSINIYGGISASGSIQINSPTVTIQQLGILTSGLGGVGQGPGDLSINASALTSQGVMTANNITITVASCTLAGSIDVSGGGFGSNSGPGAGFNGTGAGGSYGGYSVTGRETNVTFTGGPYGSISGELFFGSGGGSNFAPGGSGGGIVSISASGEISFQNSLINANGQNGSDAAGGGSGGSVYLQASYFLGSGSVSACGGASKFGGAGSGGRIWVDLTNPAMAFPAGLSFSISGGIWGANPTGGSGTLYFSHNDTLVIDNGYVSNSRPFSFGATPVNASYVASIFVRNSGVIMLANSSINCSSLSLTTGAFLIGPPNSYDGGSILVSGNFQIDANSNVQLSNWWDINATNLALSGNIFGSGLDFTITDTFWLSGRVITDGLGSGPGLGPGAGQNGMSDNPGGGAGHGAVGSSSCGAAAGGDQYGNPILPDIYGSGGGNTGTLLGGAGGGAILINAANFTFMGILSADGLPGANGFAPTQELAQSAQLDAALATSRSGAGGGSGGSISIVAQWAGISSRAAALATGGNGGNAGGSGGFAGGGGAGGRIYFFANTSVFLQNQVVQVSVSGGITPCKSTSASGTIITRCTPGHAGTETSFTCTPCTQGTYSPDGIACIACPPGTSTLYQTGQTTCTPCAAGSYTYNNGSVTCTPCSLGQYANTTGNIACRYCAAGSFSNVTGSKNCTLCPMGSSQQYPGYGYCSSCRSGTFSNVTGSTFCESCASGYSSFTGSSKCTPCGPGFYTSSYGCIQCNSGRYSNETANAYCNPCPAGSSSTYGASTCYTCNPGYTSYGGGYCSACSKGTYTPSAGMYPCLMCGPGTYQPNSGATQCLTCTGSYSYGATYCSNSDNSDSSDNPPEFLWWCIPLLFTVLLCLPAVWCWRRRRTDAYEPIRDQQSINHPRAPIAHVVSRPMEPPPFLPPLPPQRADDPLKEGEDDEPEQKECIICCDAKKDIVLLPCGHIATCEKCTRALLDTKPLCPICRQKILSFVRMYAV